MAAAAGAAAAEVGEETLQGILTLNKINHEAITPIGFVVIDRAFAEIGVSLADVQEKIDAHFFDDKRVFSAIAEIVETSRASTDGVIVDTSLQPPHAFSGDVQYLKPTPATAGRLTLMGTPESLAVIPNFIRNIGSIFSASGRFIEFCGIITNPPTLRAEMYRFRCQRCGQEVDMVVCHNALSASDHPWLHEWADFVQMHRHETVKAGRVV